MQAGLFNRKRALDGGKRTARLSKDQFSYGVVFMLRFFLFASVLVAAPTVASAEWLVAKSRHFIIYSDQKPDDLKAYATRLEKFDLAVRKGRGMDDPPLSDSNLLTVYVLANQPALESLAGRPGVAGFYIPRASGSVAFVHRGKDPRSKWELTAETVFFHEYMHHLMLQDLQLALPHWMIEGYAEFFATAEILNDGAVRFGAVPAHRAGSLFNYGTYAMRLRDMVGANYKNAGGAQIVSVYGLGWLLTHYLTFEPGRRGQATRYVEAIQKGVPARKAAEDAFGDLGKLDKELEAYLTRKTVSSVTIPATDLGVGAISIRPLGEAESAIMRVRMRSERGVDRGDAAIVAAEARRVARKYGDSAPVQAALAEAEHDAKNYEASVAAADRAIAADAKSVKAMIYKGRSMLEMGKRNRSKADWKAVRSWFAKANKLDPEDAEPLMLYYQTYKEEGAPAPKISVEGLHYAHVLVPQDSSLRFLYVRQLVAEKKVAEAKAAFTPIAYDPHLEGKSRDKMIAIMDALNAGDSAKAADLLDKREAEAEAKKKR